MLKELSELASCNLCQSKDFDVVFEQGVAQEGRVVRCRKCSLMCVNPRGRVELDDYRERGDGEDAGWELSPSSIERQQNQVSDYEDALQKATAHAPGGKVLEVGCCTGTLLNELKERGMHCTGLEPNSFAARYGRKQFGLDIRTCTVPEAKLKEGSFDVIFLLHVVEHLTDPIESLKEIRKLLKPGGLFVIETPRYDTWSFKVFGRRERNVVDNWHLFFYTTETLRRSLQAAGFEVTAKKIPGRTVNPSRLAISAGKSLHFRWLEGLGQWSAQKKVNSMLSFPLNIGDILRFYAVAEKRPGNVEPIPA